VLRTQEAPNYGLNEPTRYWYVNRQGEVVKSLPYYPTTGEVSPPSLLTDTLCFNAISFKDERQAHYVSVIVGSKAQSDSLYEVRDKLITLIH
jgi:hypothetical protein